MEKVSKEQFFKSLQVLTKGDIAAAQMVVDYIEKSAHQVTSTDLYFALCTIRGHDLAKTFTDYLEQNYNRKRVNRVL
ncbi:MAG: hypothetical protein M3Z56_08405 [Bacteroidota bacterium]|nr:hypothetical protein [Bacteroidota bacterium]